LDDVRHTAQGHRGTCRGHSFLPQREETQADDNHKAGRHPQGYEDGPAFTHMRSLRRVSFSRYTVRSGWALTSDGQRRYASLVEVKVKVMILRRSTAGYIAKVLAIYSAINPYEGRICGSHNRPDPGGYEITILHCGPSNTKLKTSELDYP
jgi:hypothetical protein